VPLARRGGYEPPAGLLCEIQAGGHNPTAGFLGSVCAAELLEASP